MSFRERGRIHTSTESPLAVKAFGIAHDAKIFQDHQRRGVSLLEDVQNLFGIPCSSSSGGRTSGAAHGGDIQNDLTQHKASERRHLPVSRTTPGDVLQESSPTSGGLSQSGGGATDCTSTHAAIDIACGECEKEDVQDGKWCQQCGMILCALCASHHQRAKASRAHPLKALDAFLEEREQESLQRKLQVLQARTRSLQQEMRQLSLHQQVAAEEQVISVLATTLESCGRVADDAGTSAEDVIASRLMRAAQGASS